MGEVSQGGGEGKVDVDENMLETPSPPPRMVEGRAPVLGPRLTPLDVCGASSGACSPVSVGSSISIGGLSQGETIVEHLPSLGPVDEAHQGADSPQSQDGISPGETKVEHSNSLGPRDDTPLPRPALSVIGEGSKESLSRSSDQSWDRESPGAASPSSTGTTPGGSGGSAASSGTQSEKQVMLADKQQDGNIHLEPQLGAEKSSGPAGPLPSPTQVEAAVSTGSNSSSGSEVASEVQVEGVTEGEGTEEGGETQGEGAVGSDSSVQQGTDMPRRSSRTRHPPSHSCPACLTITESDRRAKVRLYSMEDCNSRGGPVILKARGPKGSVSLQRICKVDLDPRMSGVTLIGLSGEDEVKVTVEVESGGNLSVKKGQILLQMTICEVGS